MKHILLAEDEQKLAVLVRQTLEQEGYKVTCVGDGTPATPVSRYFPKL
ncbi:MAG: hypothetical protein ACRD4U_07480 [Candidatus Acidiferrales bacterium]